MCKVCEKWEQHDTWNSKSETFNWNQYWTSELMETLIRFKLADNSSMFDIWDKDSW